MIMVLIKYKTMKHLQLKLHRPELLRRTL